MKMKVYVSLPISCRPIEEAKQHARKACVKLAKRGYGNSITPFDVAPEENKPYEWYMGKDIEALLKCNAVYFCRGWWRSRGCRCEMATALIYGKKIMFEK